MKKVTCVERLYRIEENNETKYFIQLKRELSDDLTNRLLHEDMEIKTFVGLCNIILPSDYQPEKIETIEIPNKIKARAISKEPTARTTSKEPTDLIKVKEFITNRFNENKDFSSIEAANELAIHPRRVKDIIQLLKNHKFVIRSNPEVKEKRQFRWIKNESVPEHNPPETELDENKSETEINSSSTEEDIIKAKDAIRDFYREGKDFNHNDLLEATGIDKKRLQYIIHKLHVVEHYIKRVDPEKNNRKARWVKAEAMIAPEHVENRNMNKLLEERKLVIDQLG